ncbi:MAG: UDP-N-acetylglucosamine 1-carboxyvinyltransferase [Syntrophomonadaceae bacterium]|nr:UDP-N-acetylglucosamine 1-carboxyvinyltransferase [Bacillota bacterium]NLM88476.1 UDP-N-acetylglucosamine 1-carboxyvinyltransferase [Syntrophomonadaceae bacterium]HAA08661.1 UDP-N-acetylglucosamine 1-carboxyvinyltransferase [Syntrophomonas sp.]HQA49107.1 UDP-N-acetylglucosamine 1-carboxyvinyltransferase [Syntrophomonadaceae bacterium]HQD90488.1 UDP-N-acetylglucosamine 1-carboxyvinyltransferase [Syntrophomonadaceae bacterium]
MDYLVVRGSKPLKGQISVSGSKNSTLPIMAASLLCSGEVVLTGVPDLEDIKVMAQALEILGAKVKREKDVLIIDGSTVNKIELPEEISRKMRASNLVMGALLSRFHHARVAYPGGCAIGTRPMDLHLKGFQSMGFTIKEEFGFMEGLGSSLGSQEILLDFPSVGATENLMMAAVLLPGTTILRNAAREPEIVDLQNFLNRMGAKIRGAGLDTIRIEGVSRLGSVEHAVIPDRIEAGTFMVAAAISRGEVFIENVVLEHVQPVVSKLREIGAEVLTYNSGIKVVGGGRLRPADIKTMPYPGFPTDMQPQIMALLSSIVGTSVLVETIFENRFMHVQELRRMGADIKVEGRVAIIKGKNRLEGASVEATDLRAGAALILAGLFADGETHINRIDHIDRGYDKIHVKLQSIGADITRGPRT